MGAVCCLKTIVFTILLYCFEQSRPNAWKCFKDVYSISVDEVQIIVVVKTADEETVVLLGESMSHIAESVGEDSENEEDSIPNQTRPCPGSYTHPCPPACAD